MLERVLIALQELQAEHAKEALGAPSHKDAFGYGHAVGHYQGLERAIEAVMHIMAPKEEDEE